MCLDYLVYLWVAHVLLQGKTGKPKKNSCQSLLSFTSKGVFLVTWVGQGGPAKFRPASGPSNVSRFVAWFAHASTQLQPSSRLSYARYCNDSTHLVMWKRNQHTMEKVVPRVWNHGLCALWSMGMEAQPLCFMVPLVLKHCGTMDLKPTPLCIVVPREQSHKLCSHITPMVPRCCLQLLLRK